MFGGIFVFGYSDKVTLTLINGTDTDCCPVPFILKLPVEQDFNIPEDLASLDVFEYQEGFSNHGMIVFSVFVGEKSTIEELTKKNDGLKLSLRRGIEIPGVDSPICYQVVNGQKKIFANVEDGDLVVRNHEELKHVIKELSTDYNIFYNAVQKIKTFGERFNK